MYYFSSKYFFFSGKSKSEFESKKNIYYLFSDEKNLKIFPQIRL
ncbi:hypothetical protein CM15mP35_05770 [bacterium]|nr:MAG: hypothetical protein CM15mP35_05770 [bacterium]